MLTINATKLLKPLQSVSGIVERRHTLPILSNVLWEITSSHLKMTATDLEIQIQTIVDLSDNKTVKSQSTETTLPARKMLDILRTLPDGIDMKFTKSDGVIKNKCTRKYENGAFSFRRNHPAASRCRLRRPFRYRLLQGAREP